VVGLGAIEFVGGDDGIAVGEVVGLGSFKFVGGDEDKVVGEVVGLGAIEFVGGDGGKAVGDAVGLLGAIELVGDGTGVNGGSREPPDTAVAVRMMWRMIAETQTSMIVARMIMMARWYLFRFVLCFVCML